MWNNQYKTITNKFVTTLVIIAFVSVMVLLLYFFFFLNWMYTTITPIIQMTEIPMTKYIQGSIPCIDAVSTEFSSNFSFVVVGISCDFDSVVDVEVDELYLSVIIVNILPSDVEEEVVVRKIVIDTDVMGIKDVAGSDVVGCRVEDDAVIGCAVVGSSVVGCEEVGDVVVGFIVVGDADVGKSVVGLDVVGLFVVGIIVVGVKVVGDDVVGYEVGENVVGIDVVGIDVVGIDVVGPKVVGKAVVGLDVVGSFVVGVAVVGNDVVGVDVIGGGVITVGWYVGVAVNSSGTDDGQLVDKQVNEDARVVSTDIALSHIPPTDSQYKLQSPSPQIILIPSTQEPFNLSKGVYLSLMIFNCYIPLQYILLQHL